MQHPYLKGKHGPIFLKHNIELVTKRTNQPSLNHKLLTLIGLLWTCKMQLKETASPQHGLSKQGFIKL